MWCTTRRFSTQSQTRRLLLLFDKVLIFQLVCFLCVYHSFSGRCSHTLCDSTQQSNSLLGQRKWMSSFMTLQWLSLSLFLVCQMLLVITFGWFHTLVKILGTKCKSPIYVAFDAGIVSQTMMMAAHFFGIGSLSPHSFGFLLFQNTLCITLFMDGTTTSACPVTCASFAEDFTLECLHADPKEEELCVAISFGYPSEDAHPVDFCVKKTPDELATWLMD